MWEKVQFLMDLPGCISILVTGHGKTVGKAQGICEHMHKKFLLVDIPGTYSIMSNSEEEEIARNYICFGEHDATIIVLDATCLERNLNLVYQVLEITNKVVVCVNLLDEAEKKGISIDFSTLSESLGVPVVGTTAKKPRTLKKLMDTVIGVCEGTILCTPHEITYPPCVEEAISLLEPYVAKRSFSLPSRWICLKWLDGNTSIMQSIEEHTQISFDLLSSKKQEAEAILDRNSINTSTWKDVIVSSIVFEAEELCRKVVHYHQENYSQRDRKIDKILTSKLYGIPIMLLFLGAIFWITITGANYPSSLLSACFNWFEEQLLNFLEWLHFPPFLVSLLVTGMYRTVAWIVAVMLPPMAIFFPLFTLLEDLGYLPRIAFNLDKFFKKACTSGKQALTMCMGFGCNAAGVVGCRIIDSPRERLIATITNAFVPCNGRFPFLITVAMIFFGSSFGGFSTLVSTGVVLLVIVLGILLSLLISKILSHTILKGVPSSFVLELPPYRKPQIGKVLIRSIFDRTLFVLGRAVAVAAPTGIVIWILANVMVGDVSLLGLVARFFDPFAKLMGLDGYILTAFILGLPANEIVLPIILMGYLSQGSLVDLEDISSISNILLQNGWTMLTAINVMLFTLLHFPCSTTLLTIKKETGSLKWTIVSFLIPTVCGILFCMLTTFVWNIFI